MGQPPLKSGCVDNPNRRILQDFKMLWDSTRRRQTALARHELVNSKPQIQKNEYKLFRARAHS
jgi:hypothetical protein